MLHAKLLRLALTALLAHAAYAQTTLSTSTSSLVVVQGGETSSTTPAGGAAATTAAGVVQLSTNDNPADWTDGPSWLKTHWQWVVMIVVLAVVLAAIGIVGTIIYKRKSKSRERGINNTAPMRSNPTINSWAPSRHSVHDFGTPTRDVSPPPPMPEIPADSRRQSRRLGKAPVTTN